MKRIALLASLLLAASSSAGQFEAPAILDVNMTEQDYAVAKQTLIEGDLIGRLMDCAVRLNAIAMKNGVTLNESYKNVNDVSEYCASELSYALNFHPKEFASFVKLLDSEGVTRSLWLNSKHYKYHQAKLKENATLLPTKLYAALSNEEPPESVVVTCNAACQEEAKRLNQSEGGMGVLVFSMAAQAGLATLWGGTVYVKFGTHTEQWQIPMGGNKAYFTRELPPGEPPILNPF